MKRIYLLTLIILVSVVGGILIWGIQHRNISNETLPLFAEIKARISSIPTPDGWYLWYGGILENPPHGVEVLFGNSEFNKNSFDNDPSYPRVPTVSINVYGESLSGKTPEQWINYNQTYGGYNGDPSFRVATSSGNTFSTENDRLVIENITTNMGGSHILSYYLFDDSLVYDFSLNSVAITPDSINSPDAQILRGMVKQFAESLPSITKQ